MSSLLQTLLLETLPAETDPILRRYIDVVVPAMEREFAGISALGGSESVHLKLLQKLGDRYAEEKARRWGSKPDQNLLVHVLNALLIAWNLAEKHLNTALSEPEKYLLCLGITLHDYNKYCNGNGEAPPKAHEVPEILELCRDMGESLNFTDFWPEWQDYVSDIAFLAQNTQGKHGTNLFTSNWPNLKLDDDRLFKPLRKLLAFGDIAVHLEDPAEIVSTTKGDRLRDFLRRLKINKTLVYHRLRDSLGLLTNSIHNDVVAFAEKLGWEPIIFFAQGTVYLAPPQPEVPDREELKNNIWQAIGKKLAEKMGKGEIGFKRDGKGLKVAPQTLELFAPGDLICQLPEVIDALVKNEKNPATPKRLNKLVEKGELTPEEREELEAGAHCRADRLAEFIIIVQREFLPKVTEYVPWILEALEVSDRLTPEQTQTVVGGVNYGWYRAAALYMARHATFDEEDAREHLSELAERLADWAEEEQLLANPKSPTREVFDRYLERYLDISGWEPVLPDFQQELDAYAAAKTKAAKEPICSLSSGEFPSEEQRDSVVLFKPQQYSNKNPLGGGKIKRGISKIWALEMLLRQAFWSAQAGKFEEQQPIFLYLYPAYVYSPQITRAMRRFIQKMKRMSLWDVRKHWLEAGMQSSGWQKNELWLDDEPEAGKSSKTKYDNNELPFIGTFPTTTRGKTLTDAWVLPAFLALAMPQLLGVRVVATSSNVPLYDSDRDFPASTVLDGVAGFWSLLQSSSDVRIQDLEPFLNRLLAAYVLHLDNRSNPPDARWQAFNGTVREIATDVLNVFAIAQEGLRRDNSEPLSQKKVNRYWYFAEIFAQGDSIMQDKLRITKQLVEEYRRFYRVNLDASSHAILLPLSKALELILAVPEHLDDEELIFQGAGQLHDALDRQSQNNKKSVYRPLLQDKSIPYPTRKAQELEAIHAFMTTCVS